MPHSFDHWADTDDASSEAIEWAEAQPELDHLWGEHAEILARFLATPDAADAHARYCDDLIADHADRQQEERRDR
jgi:hypothetical protein